MVKREWSNRKNNGYNGNGPRGKFNSCVRCMLASGVRWLQRDSNPRCVRVGVFQCGWHDSCAVTALVTSRGDHFGWPNMSGHSPGVSDPRGDCLTRMATRGRRPRPRTSLSAPPSRSAVQVTHPEGWEIEPGGVVLRGPSFGGVRGFERWAFCILHLESHAFLIWSINCLQPPSPRGSLLSRPERRPIWRVGSLGRRGEVVVEVDGPPVALAGALADVAAEVGALDHHRGVGAELGVQVAEVGYTVLPNPLRRLGLFSLRPLARLLLEPARARAWRVPRRRAWVLAVYWRASVLVYCPSRSARPCVCARACVLCVRACVVPHVPLALT